MLHSLLISKSNAGYVMFGNGVRGKIFRKGSINQASLSYLQDVGLVKRLFANLISISQLCDHGFSVN